MISVQGAMDEEGGGFDPILDLNSQAPETEDFPDLGLYGNIPQGDLSASRLPLYRPPRAGAGDARASYARQLLFGDSTSAAASRGGGSVSGGGRGVRQHANSATAAPGHRPQLSNTAGRRTSS